MRKLATAGSILLACLLGFSAGAQARNRYTASQTPVTYSQDSRADEAQPYYYSAPVERAPARLAARHSPLSILPRRAPMANLVLAAARRYGVPLSLAYGVASVESGFNPRARSRSGAVGLMQILPATARGIGCRGSLSNPAVNADCGARYLASILHDQRGNIRMAAAMYNQGRFARRVTRGGARYAELVMRHARRIPA